MEDILHIYELPYNENVPVICMDEKPYQLLGETREPLPLRSGDNRKQIQNTSAVGHAVSLFSQNLWQIIAMLQYVNTGSEKNGRSRSVIC